MLEVLQLAMGVWDSSSEFIGRCLNYLWTKRTMEFGYGLQNAELALFCRKTVIMCSREFERQRGRVSGLLGGMKPIYNLCVSLS